MIWNSASAFYKTNRKVRKLTKGERRRRNEGAHGLLGDQKIIFIICEEVGVAIVHIVKVI